MSVKPEISVFCWLYKHRNAPNWDPYLPQHQKKLEHCFNSKNASCFLDKGIIVNLSDPNNPFETQRQGIQVMRATVSRSF